jgi:poly-gamma-glutamate synthesis protein (capsule biosynthesis protein)
MVSFLRILSVFVGGVLLGVASFTVYASDEDATTTTTVLVALVETTTNTPTTASTTTTSTSTTTTLPPKGTLVIHGTGDVAVDPSYIPALSSQGWDHAWSGLVGLFEDDDLTVINLECVPSDIGSPLTKAFTFRCPTEALPSIAANGIDVANMGNNHSGDFGKDALIDGRANLIANGIAPVGAGKDIHEAGKPAVFEIEGWTVAVVGFGGVAPGESWYATEASAGMRSGNHIDQMVEAVAAASEVADIVIVTIHWGVELDTTPRPREVARAEAMVEAGADIIFGHHQHRLNPLEIVDGAAVFWGLGNFVWPHNSVASATTAVARVIVTPEGEIEACMIPAFIETHGRPVLTGEPTCDLGF